MSLDYLEESYNALTMAIKQRNDARAEVARLRAALEAVEWVTDDYNICDYCPWCKKESLRDGGGHAPDCLRQIALGSAAEDNNDADA